MKKITLFLLVVFCLGLTACSKEAEVNDFISENHSVIEEIVKKIDADPTEKGVDEAQKSFDAKKVGLKAKWDAIKDASKAQVSADVAKKLNDSMLADVKVLSDAGQKLSDMPAVQKYSKLMQEYTAIINP